MEVKRWRLWITPQTHIRTNSGENWMFAVKKPVTDFDLIVAGTKKHNQDIEAGAKNPRGVNCYLNRRNTIRKYWNYKKALKAVADLERFEMPSKGAWIKFYIPIPKSWSKKKRKEMCFEVHEQTPDCDNLTKSFFDSLVKKDQVISDYRASKFWIEGRGYIEVTLGELPVANGYTKIIYRDDKIK